MGTPNQLSVKSLLITIEHLSQAARFFIAGMECSGLRYIRQTIDRLEEFDEVVTKTTLQKYWDIYETKCTDNPLSLMLLFELPDTLFETITTDKLTGDKPYLFNYTKDYLTEHFTPNVILDQLEDFCYNNKLL